MLSVLILGNLSTGGSQLELRGNLEVGEGLKYPSRSVRLWLAQFKCCRHVTALAFRNGPLDILVRCQNHKRLVAQITPDCQPFEGSEVTNLIITRGH